MDCQTCEGMIGAYINHTLSTKQIEEFLEHIETCSSCYDELETYFIVHEASQKLGFYGDDSSEDDSLDLTDVLVKDIRKSKQYVRKVKNEAYVYYSSFATSLFLLLIFIVMGIITGIY